MIRIVEPGATPYHIGVRFVFQSSATGVCFWKPENPTPGFIDETLRIDLTSQTEIETFYRVNIAFITDIDTWQGSINLQWKWSDLPLDDLSEHRCDTPYDIVIAQFPPIFYEVRPVPDWVCSDEEMLEWWDRIAPGNP